MSNRFTRLLYESGQGWGREIMPYLSVPEVRPLSTVNKACHHAIHRPSIKKGWDWEFHYTKGHIQKELASPLQYPELIWNTESELLVSGSLSQTIFVMSKEDGRVITTLTTDTQKESTIWALCMIDTELYVLLYDEIHVLKSIYDDTVVRKWDCLGLDMVSVSHMILVLYEYTITMYDTQGELLHIISLPTQKPCKSLAAIHDDIAVLDSTQKQVLVLSLSGDIKYTIPCPFVSSAFVCMTFTHDTEEIIVSDNTSSVVGSVHTYSKTSRTIHSHYFKYPQMCIKTTEGLWVVDRNRDKICLVA
jgi:WD40 repeat protein